MTNKLSREEVYKLIDGEREYQDGLWGEAHDAGESVGSFLIYMQTYLDEARRALTYAVGDKTALDVVRKITTLGVACMELFGAPARGGDLHGE